MISSLIRNQNSETNYRKDFSDIQTQLVANQNTHLSGQSSKIQWRSNLHDSIKPQDGLFEKSAEELQWSNGQRLMKPLILCPPNPSSVVGVCVKDKAIATTIKAPRWHHRRKNNIMEEYVS